MFEIVEIQNYEAWDKLVENSPQGTIFATTLWCSLFPDTFKIYGCYRHDELIGGIIGFQQDDKFISGNYPITPFQGVIVKDMPDTKAVNIESITSDISTELAKYFASSHTEITNHWAFIDARPFIWAGWKTFIRYTYVIDMYNPHPVWGSMEKDTRNLAMKAERNGIEAGIGKLEAFYEIYKLTFKKKGLEVPVDYKFLESLPNKKVYLAWSEYTPSAGAIIVEDNKRVYYMFAATNPAFLGNGASSMLLWKIIYGFEGQHKEMDLVGCNVKEIGLFKRGFGGKLTPYFGVSNV